MGKYKSKAIREKYVELIAEYTANNRKLPPTRSQSELLIETLIFRYLEYTEKYYSNQWQADRSVRPLSARTHGL